MKKILKYLFLFTLCFLTYKNVYASTAYVCSTCDYTSLDHVFSAIETGYFSDDYVEVYLYDSTSSYSLTRDYRLQQYVLVYQNNSINGNSLTIDGKGHTITSDYGLFFGSYDVKLVVKNLEIQCSSNLYVPFALRLNSYYSTISVDNLTINYSGRLRSDSSYYGLFISTYDFSISNSTISNFAYAISNDSYLQRRVDSDFISYFESRNEEIGAYGNGSNITSISIDSSDLYDNMFTLYGTFDGEITDSKIASISLFNEDRDDTNLIIDSSNDYGDVKIKRIDTDDFYDGGGMDGGIKSSPSSNDIYDQILNHDYLFVITDRYSNVEIEAKKNNSFNINNTKSVDLLSYFIDQEDINLRDYEFEVSDPSVASVENGQVVFLKSGEVDVTATNKKTGDVYTVHLKLESPKTSSNPKTSNSLLILLAITILTLSSLFIFHKKQTSTL